MAAVIHAIRQAHRKEREKQDYFLPEKAKQQNVVRRFQSRNSTGAGSSEGRGWRKYQPMACVIYNHIYVQASVAGLIGLNFFVNIIQAQIDPTGKKMVDEFAVWEVFFNVVFLMELILNMYSTWFKKFWKSGWNVFDFAVVLIGWMFQLNLPLPGPMKLLRMMRAFRVFRLFKRVESLRKIMSSLARAVPGVMNAFLIQLIIVCIYAIIAVDRFRDWGENGTMTNEKDVDIPLQTSRGQNYGFEYYGDFGKALYTMFQVLTGESWAEAVARPLFNSNSATTSVGAAFFFVFFSILNGVVLINVVVAVLLEKMVDEEGDEGAGEGGGNEDDDEDDPTREHTVEEDVRIVHEMVYILRQQMEECFDSFGNMQKELGDVNVIKEQVSALLKHDGLNVEFKPVPIEVPAAPAPADSDGKVEASNGSPVRPMAPDLKVAASPESVDTVEPPQDEPKTMEDVTRLHTGDADSQSYPCLSPTPPTRDPTAGGETHPLGIAE